MKIQLALLVILATFLVGCSTTVEVSGTVPTPLVKKIPANVGVFYDEKFKNFRHSEALEAEGKWNINLGEQNLTFFQNLMGSLFESATVLSGPELNSPEAAGLDAIVIPTIEKYGFLTPNLSGLKFYSSSIHYRINMLDSEGNELADWTVVGYGKSEGGVFGGNAALGNATMLAIRDGGARIAIELPSEPKVAQWIAKMEQIIEQEGANAN